METKEAIKLIKILKDALYEAYLIGKTYVGGTEGFQKNIDDIISLLEQGEAYRGIVKELKEFYGNGIVENECGFGVQLFNLIEILEGKYFPKEVEDGN